MRIGLPEGVDRVTWAKVAMQRVVRWVQPRAGEGRGHNCSDRKVPSGW